LEIHVEQLVRERARWIAALREVPEVLEVLGLSGPTDLLVRVAARDADDPKRV
jgi:DNA-binding Lrp family transcriptional regulator